MTFELPSFSRGFPVEIVRTGKTITIEKSRVRVVYRGRRQLFRRGWEAPISEFETVEISSRTFYDRPDSVADDAPPGITLWSSEKKIRVKVTLRHRWSLFKDVRLAEWEFDEPSPFTSMNVAPLRRLWNDAAQSLSLRKIDNETEETRKSL